MRPISLPTFILASYITCGSLASSIDIQEPTVVTPISIEVTPSLVANVAQNTHISITRPDHNKTVVPVVGGQECWFCIEYNADRQNDTNGWALLGIDAPGVYQPFSTGISMSFPAIIVSENGDPSYLPKYIPSITTGSVAGMSKRDTAIPTTTSFSKSLRYRRLETAFTNYKSSHKDSDIVLVWMKTAGYAMKIKVESSLLKIPRHYFLAAGWTKHAITDDWKVDDDCEITHVIVKVDLDFRANTYDIQAKGKRIFFFDRGSGDWADWDDDVYTLLGEIGSGVTAVTVQNLGKMVAANMNDQGGYNLITNNCRDFVIKFWAAIQLL